MKLELTEQEINQVVDILSQGQWRVVNPLIGKIAQQVQDNKEPKAKKEKEKPEK